MYQPFRHPLAALYLSFCALAHPAAAQPTVTSSGQPKDYSVSLGATVTNQVLATTPSPPLAYQWRFNDTPVPGANSHQLVLREIQSTDDGGYSVVVSDSTGSVTSRVARLEVDRAFTKITTGPLATDLNTAESATWADFDNDHDLDLLVAGYKAGRPAFYRNDGGGGFTRLTDPQALPFLNVRDAALSACGDFNNDGRIDVVVTTWDPLDSSVLSRDTHLYWNDGDGRFSEGQVFEPCSGWYTTAMDFDQDGFLDLFLGRDSTRAPLLLRNDGRGGFIRQTPDQVGPLLDPGWDPKGLAFADYDDDGLLDVFAPYSGSSPKTNLLFRGVGAGRFERVLDSAVRHTGVRPFAGAWGDLDNDGRLDLIVASHRTPDGVERSVGIYLNLGGGKFEDVTTTALADNPASFKGFVTLADYDNDGYLDAIALGFNPRLLLHNNGDGTFTRVTSGSLVNDPFYGGGAPWADYDNDGFPDLFLPNANPALDAGRALLPGYLYRNSGNTNHWLKVKPVGTASNRMGAGAKVRLRTVVEGREMWQRRDISAGAPDNGSHHDAHFGLGRATHAALVRIEWPSGAVQELTGIAADQVVTVVEPAPWRLSADAAADGPRVLVQGPAHGRASLEASGDLRTWSLLSPVTTDAAGVATVPVSPDATTAARFYRVRVP